MILLLLHFDLSCLDSKVMSVAISDVPANLSTLHSPFLQLSVLILSRQTNFMVWSSASMPKAFLINFHCQIHNQQMIRFTCEFTCGRLHCGVRAWWFFMVVWFPFWGILNWTAEPSRGVIIWCSCIFQFPLWRRPTPNMSFVLIWDTGPLFVRWPIPDWCQGWCLECQGLLILLGERDTYSHVVEIGLGIRAWKWKQVHGWVWIECIGKLQTIRVKAC